MGDHGDWARCHADNPTCGCVLDTFPYDRPDAAKRLAAEIGGTVEAVLEDPDGPPWGDMVWEVRFPLSIEEN